MTQLLSALLTPYGGAGTLLLLGIITSLIKRPRLAFSCYVSAVAIIVIFSTPYVSDTLLHKLESAHVDEFVDITEVDALVLLAGGLKLPSTNRSRAELGERGDRILKTFELYQSGISSTIIISGGSRRLVNENVTESELTKDILISWGVPESAIITESQSTNTRESVIEVVNLAQSHELHKLGIVTSGYHMPRAISLFSKFDEVEICPVLANILIGDIKNHPTLWIPTESSLTRSTLALHEYVGMFYNTIAPLEPTL